MDFKTTEEDKKHSALIERCLNRSCDQMEMLVIKIRHLGAKLERAEENENVVVRRNLNLQLEVLHRVYSMYYSYSEVKATQIMLLTQQFTANKV